jgi:purine-nucleoside/S-methyl-5'-thioadenosine phosphorylase / adenosine deaminase
MKPQLGTDFDWIDAAGRRALVCRPLAAHARHLFTTREWALGSAVDGDDPAAWSQVAGTLGVPDARLVRMRQVHGASVLVRRPGDAIAGERADGDIAISNDPAVAVAIQTADCVPLLMADVRTGAVAAAHAGWRGLASRVPAVAVDAMTREFGTRPGDLVAAAGPSISAARYEVGGEVRSRFASVFGTGAIARWFPRETRASHFEFDGWTATRDQLLDAGVQPDAIHLSTLCTAAHPELCCSYRRDGKRAGRMAAAIRAARV